jgi:hypothetical protein
VVGAEPSVASFRRTRCPTCVVATSEATGEVRDEGGAGGIVPSHAMPDGRGGGDLDDEQVDDVDGVGTSDPSCSWARWTR